MRCRRSSVRVYIRTHTRTHIYIYSARNQCGAAATGHFAGAVETFQTLPRISKQLAGPLFIAREARCRSRSTENIRLLARLAQVGET